PRDSRIRSPRTLPTPFFLCTPPPPPHISTLSLHDALPIFGFLGGAQVDRFGNLNTTVIGDYAHPKVRLPGSGGATEIATSCGKTDRKSTRLNSSHSQISYAVFCLKKKRKNETIRKAMQERC